MTHTNPATPSSTVLTPEVAPTSTFETVATEEDQQEMDRFLSQQEEDEADGDEGLWSDLDDEIEDFLADTDKDPSQLRRAEGENLWVGFDAEWVYDPARDQNRILSIQL